MVVMPNLLENLNDEQHAAVTHTSGPLLIIAGAGTGKTTVLTHRIAHLIEQGMAKPEEIVALTFTEKAAREMSDRVDRLLNTSYTSITIATFHAFCQQLLERYGLDIGLPAPFRLLTPPECWRLMKENFERFNLDYYRPLATPTRFLQGLIQHFSRCKDELILPEEYLHYATELQGDTDLAEFTRKKMRVGSADDERILEIAKTKEIADAYHVYQAILLEHHALDFGDLLLYAHHLLEMRPNVTRALQEQHRFILVDEFQDTNWAQYQLLRKLVNDEANIAVVGDDDQSIYKWRGAAISNVLQFTKDFPQTRTVALTANYRSAQPILDRAYAVIQRNNPNRLEVQIGVSKQLRAARTHYGTVAHVNAATGEGEAAFVATRIRALHEEGAPWGEMAVLARAHSHLDSFVQALERHGIPYQYHAATGLLKTPFAVTALAILRALMSYYDNTALYRVTQMPPFRLNPDDHAALLSFERRETTYYDTLNRALTSGAAVSDDGKARITRLLQLIRSHAARIHDEPAGVILLSFLEESGYLKQLADSSHKQDAVAIETLLHLQTFFDLIEQFCATYPEPTVRAFVAYVDDLLESGDEGGAPRPLLVLDAVQLLTIHGAKGLEFQHVFVVNLVERRFPTDARHDAIPVPDALVKETIPPGDHHLEEERRLFYVALTRAKISVTATSATSYGGARDKKVSRFIEELGVESTSASGGSNQKPAITAAAPPVERAAAALPLPTHFSFSQLKAYETCPLQYKFAHILHIPTFGKPSFTFGQTMHRTLQRFYERVQALNSVTQQNLFVAPAGAASKEIRVPSCDELLDIYAQSWADEWYGSKKQRDTYFEEGKRMLRDFFEQQETAGWRVPRLLERGFTIRINRVTVRGRIDRIDQTADGGLVIIDYKTGKPKTALDTDDKEQLYLYHIAANEVPELRALGQTVELTFYYLEDGSRQSFIGTPEALERYKQKVLTTVQRIEARDFAPDPGPFKCRTCDFRDICEFRQLS